MLNSNGVFIVKREKETILDREFAGKRVEKSAPDINSNFYGMLKMNK